MCSHRYYSLPFHSRGWRCLKCVPLAWRFLWQQPAWHRILADCFSFQEKGLSQRMRRAQVTRCNSCCHCPSHLVISSHPVERKSFVCASPYATSVFGHRAVKPSRTWHVCCQPLHGHGWTGWMLGLLCRWPHHLGWIRKVSCVSCGPGTPAPLLAGICSLLEEGKPLLLLHMPSLHSTFYTLVALED